MASTGLRTVRVVGELGLLVAVLIKRSININIKTLKNKKAVLTSHNCAAGFDDTTGTADMLVVSIGYKLQVREGWTDEGSVWPVSF